MLSNNLLLAGDDGYNLTNSLRFRSSASAFLNRTPASNGNLNTWTISWWCKRGELGSNSTMFGTSYTSLSELIIRFNADNTFRFEQYSAGGGTLLGVLSTTQVFRDPSAWYHFVINYDSANATSTERVRLYVNGSRVTNFTSTSFPALNANSVWNTNTHNQFIGKYSTAQHFDGYQTEINFIDGQALTPNSFGSYNQFGVWQPIRYGGSYGTNGFYLKFNNNASTTTLGLDSSPQNNNWTTNNISVTTGSTYDSMTDVPTLTSTTAANYCVMNPLFMSGTATPTNGNLTVSQANNQSQVAGTFGMSSGKWYYEHTVTAAGGEMSVGIGSAPATGIVGVTSTQYGYFNINGQKYNSNAGVSYGATFTTGDVIGVAYDADVGSLTFYKNNTTQGTAFTGITGTMFPLAATRTSGGQNTSDLNFGQRPFTYTPPTGFVALNTFNLPNSTIVAGNKQMDATLYTGTGSALSVTNAGGFQPDLVWLKGRSFASFNGWIDSVRGRAFDLYSNSTSAEETSGSTEDLTSFNANGFSLGTSARFASNNSGQTYVSWQWKAGGAAVTNTAGTRTSQVSANTTSGFSVVTFTGNATSGATVGHGLGVAPSMVIVKVRSTTGDWPVYHVSTGNTKALYLNLTNAQGGDFTGAWNNTTPTSTVFTLGNSTETNANTRTFVAYCWAPIAGYSAFGSYTGNGSADGPFVYTGFRPAFVMLKRIDTTGIWYVWDNKRIIQANGDAGVLQPQSADAEADYNASGIDLLSNGFKIRNLDSSDNGSSGTIIYMAFAENPLKHSLAR